jgi:outer membrane protein OmpA-like peptidoglycan-associated protein
MRDRIVVGVLALAACLPAPVVAQEQPAAATAPMASRNRGSGWELSLSGGAAFLSDTLAGRVRATDRAASRVAMGGVARLGYNFTDSWGLSVGTGVGRASPATVIQPFFALTWTPNINSRTSPFLTTGFGASYTLWSTTSSDSLQCAGQKCKVAGLGWHLGFGVRQMVSENLALRVEAREQYERYDKATIAKPVFNSIGSIGLSWFFGGGRIVATSPASVAMTPRTVMLEALGATEKLSASPMDNRGRPLAGRAITWASDNDSVVTVSATGLVTARRSGSATVTAASGDATGMVSVTVSQTVATLAIAPASAALTAIGQTQQFAPTAQDAGDNPIANPSVTWSSSDSAVASVNASGLATAVKNGTATITAAASGRTALATLDVSQMPASVAVTPATATSTTGGTIQFAAQALDANGSPITGRTITWTSDAPGVATVSPTGLARAVGNGTAQVIAAVEGKTGSAALTVAMPGRGAAPAAAPAAAAPPPAAPAIELPAVNAAGLVLNNVVFRPNSARLPPDALASLDAVASALRDIPNVQWEIGGHTSNMGAAAQNRRLSQRRAAAVKAYLVRQGVPASNLVAVGYGAERPIATNATLAGRRQNIRVEIRRLR